MRERYTSLGRPQFSIDQGFDESQITIPAVSPWYVVTFLFVWLTGWSFGGYFAMQDISSDADNFLKIWPLFWFFGILAVCYQLAWFFTGKEVVRLVAGDLEISKQVLGISRRKLFRGNEVRDLQVVLSNPKSTRGNDLAADLYEKLPFAYGNKTIRFAKGIDPTQAAEIKDLIQARLPNA